MYVICLESDLCVRVQLNSPQLQPAAEFISISRVKVLRTLPVGTAREQMYQSCHQMVYR
jgi:hypothetical protein